MPVILGPFVSRSTPNGRFEMYEPTAPSVKMAAYGRDVGRSLDAGGAAAILRRRRRDPSIVRWHAYQASISRATPRGGGAAALLSVSSLGAAAIRPPSRAARARRAGRGSRRRTPRRGGWLPGTTSRRPCPRRGGCGRRRRPVFRQRNVPQPTTFDGASRAPRRRRGPVRTSRVRLSSARLRRSAPADEQIA